MGATVGRGNGPAVGLSEGGFSPPRVAVGALVLPVGLNVGDLVGRDVGLAVGESVGLFVG